MDFDFFIIGSGGHAKVIADASGGRPGFIDTPEKCDGVRVISESDFFSRHAANNLVICGIGSVKDASVRREIVQKYSSANSSFKTVVHRGAQVASNVLIGDGTFVAQGANIVTGAKIGAHGIINTGAVVDHDVILGENVHIAPGAILLGGVNIGDNVLVGAGSIIRQCVAIASGTVIGAGSVVLESITERDSVWVGNPLKKLR